MGYESIYLTRHFLRHSEHSSTGETAPIAEVIPLDLPFVDESISLGVVFSPSTRMVLGFHVGPGPVAAVLGQAVLNAIGSKSYVPLIYPEVVSSWPCEGKIDRLILDHHVDAALLALLNGLRIECQHARRSALKRDMTEGFFLNVRRALASLGTKSGRIVSSSRPERITLHEIRLRLHWWVLDVYHHTLHPRIGMTPLQRWELEQLCRP